MKIGFNVQQNTIWQRMRTENHPIWQRLLTESRGYEDYGMRDGLLYAITGTVSYAQAAWAKEKYRMTANPSRNETRHQLNTMALLYAWIFDGLDAQGKIDFTAAMERWVNLALVNTRASDSDELVGHYFGVALYALAIKDRNPARYTDLLTRIGGFDATGTNMTTWRNALKKFSLIAFGGQWIESSNYNINTARYLIYGIKAINDFFDMDKFPEYYHVDFAVAQTAEVTHNLRDTFQWGDCEEVRQMSKFRRVPFYSVLGGITKNPQVLYMMDRLLETANFPGIWYAYYDPYAARQPIGDLVYNASGMGIATFRKGDKLFGSIMKPRTYVDHEFDMFSNFNLYEGTAWTITNPRGYYSNLYNEARYHNNLRVWGFMPTVFQEFKKQIDFRQGDDWMYHAGTTKGQSQQLGGALPVAVLKEWTRQICYLENDAIVIFDRVECKDPKSLGDTDFNKYRSELRALYTPNHQFILHMPAGMTVQNGEYVWASNGRTLKMKAYFDHDYTYGTFDGWGATPATENKNWLNLKTRNTQEWMTLLTVIKLRDISVTNPMAGEIIVGSTLIRFNPNRGETPTFEISRDPGSSSSSSRSSSSSSRSSSSSSSSSSESKESVPSVSSSSSSSKSSSSSSSSRSAAGGIPVIIVNMTEFKKRTKYYLDQVKSGQIKLFVTYYAKKYEISFIG